MSNTTSFVSIILPVSNQERFLSTCLDSLKAQTHKDIEIIAIDDNSKDNSFKILKKYHTADKRFRVYKNKKKYGLTVSLNRALKRAKGSYIAFMDASDQSSVKRIKNQLSYLTSHPKTVAIGTQAHVITRSNRKVGKTTLPQEHAQISESLLLGTSIQPESIMVNRRLLPKDVLKFQPKRYPFLYTELYIKLCSYGEFANLNQPLYNKRKLDDQNVSVTLQINHLTSFIKLWFKSLTIYDYKPSLRSLFTPLIRQA